MKLAHHTQITRLGRGTLLYYTRLNGNGVINNGIFYYNFSVFCRENLLEACALKQLY